MGAWGTGSFENDDAADWVYELEKSTDFLLLEQAFARVAKPTGLAKLFKRDQLESPDCCVALAAAEVVAALHGNPAAQLPDEVRQWITAQNKKPDAKLLDAARSAVARIGENSELKDLWEESDSYEEWRQSLASLASRLSS